MKSVRIYGLWERFVSNTVIYGRGLPIIGKLLSYTHVQATTRCAHLAADLVRNYADSVSYRISPDLKSLSAGKLAGGLFRDH